MNLRLPALLGLVLLAVHSAIFAADSATPAPRIAKFSGDRAAALSYTFDDGLRDQFTHAAPMLDEAGFKGTFFVIPGRVSPDASDAEARQGDKRAWGTITWDELRDLSARGHEIANHTWSHPNLVKLPPDEITAQIDQAADAIAREIGRPTLTLAFPFNADTPEIRALAFKRHVATRDYQMGVGGKTTAESFNAWADKQVRDRAWGVAMFHGIVRGYAALSDPEIFRAHLKHVKTRNADLWVATFADVARYTKERDAATLTVASSAPGRLVFTLTAPLDPAIYDVPLTVVLDIPTAKSARAERAGKPLPVRVTPTVVHIDAAPTPGPITVSWQ